MKFFKNKLLIPLIIGIIVSVIIITLSVINIFNIPELRALDMRFIYRLKTPAVNKDIVIIAIDDESLRRNPKPLVFWGGEFGRVIQKLSENDVKAIGLDYIQRIPLVDYPGLQENDDKFRMALSLKKTVVLTYLNEEKEFEKPPNSITAAMGEPPPPDRKEPFVRDNNFGAGNLQPDPDNFYRTQPLIFQDKNNNRQASLALATAAKYLDIKLFDIKEVNEGLQAGEKIIPLYDKKGRSMYINFSGPAGTFPKIPFYKVLEEGEKNNTAYFKENFSGKIALIGITSMGEQDFVLTPYNTFLINPEMMTGIEFHANTINTIINKSYIYKMPGPAVSLLIIIFSLLTVIICSFMDFTKGTVSSVILILIYGGISLLCFNFACIWLETVAPVTAIICCYSMVYIYNYIRLGKEKREINFMFERFVSAPVVKKMLEDPASLKLGGNKKEVTILFSDINDFTTVSEKTDPEDLIGLLNNYLTLMTDIILESGGTLNQFVGDEIMVIYNAPLEQEDHAKRAVRAGIAMLKKLDELREQGDMDIKVKIGIHTGEAVLGNVGSKKRMQYTGVGDTVNYASRVMNLTKELGTFFLISEETYQRVKDLEEKEGIKFVPMERKTVKGKSGMYLTYEVKYDIP